MRPSVASILTEHRGSFSEMKIRRIFAPVADKLPATFLLGAKPAFYLHGKTVRRLVSPFRQLFHLIYRPAFHGHASLPPSIRRANF